MKLDVKETILLDKVSNVVNSYSKWINSIQSINQEAENILLLFVRANPNIHKVEFGVFALRESLTV